MLSESRITREALVLLASGGLMLAGTSAAVANGPVKCPPGAVKCDVTAEDPKKPGDGGSGDTGGGSGDGASSGGCRRANGQEIPCSVPGLGSWDGSMCYWLLVDPQPPADAFVWGKNKPSEGAIYRPTSCPDFNYVGAGTFVPRDMFFADGELGKAPTVTPEEVAQRAVKQMTLKGPDIGIVPEPGKTGLVGLPVWMWNNQGETTTGPQTVTASAGAVTVTATAEVDKVVWNMGDGTSVTCTKPGTPYKAGYGKRKSPDCGHVYSRTSKGKSGNKYKITTTATWTIHWEGGGKTGDLTEIRESDTEIAIGELQVVG
ncbi:hypothetical protein OG735_23955 [Streptomyces sp. NBC_01210]|uniref:hypothetical protein n=1 Tax=Streptomyces sp. NBC_01210 TaxID=2903774 RepID=UPI002E1491BB|nr:hypothetical protein OG735_23955 [Streptomyces sp. NBC_01210]